MPSYSQYHCPLCSTTWARTQALFKSETPVLTQNRPRYSADLNSKAPGDSKSTVLHWGGGRGVLAANQECPATVTVAPLPNILKLRSTIYDCMSSQPCLRKALRILHVDNILDYICRVSQGQAHIPVVCLLCGLPLCDGSLTSVEHAMLLRLRSGHTMNLPVMMNARRMQQYWFMATWFTLTQQLL